jgi:hypothetical protein
VHAAEGFPGEAADIVPRILVNQYDAPAVSGANDVRHAEGVTSDSNGIPPAIATSVWGWRPRALFDNILFESQT